MQNKAVVNTRASYRIDDEIDFAYYIIPDNQSENTINEAMLYSALFDEKGEQHFHLMQQFRTLEKGIARVKQTIHNDNPALADYFQYLEYKFELLANTLLQAEQRPMQCVNLSVGGLGFFTHESIRVGTRLKVKLILQNGQGIIANAVVVNCSSPKPMNANHPYRISTQFNDLAEMDEQAIMQHIMQKQLAELKAKRGVNPQ
jgi:hypothetical protein